MEKEIVSKIKNIINYNFKDVSLLKTAFTHSSFAYTHNIESNERLEFLGDSVLNFCTTKYLFDNFNFTEGEFSKIRAYLVSSEYLSEYIKSTGLINYLQCNNFDPHSSTNVMGDLFEAIVGAMLLDADLETCKNFIHKSLKYSKQLVDKVHLKTKDFKTELQELVQSKEDIKPEYVLLEKTGPAHMPMFTVQVKINGKDYASASAKSKKEAENLAAQKTIDIIKSI